MKKVLAIFFLIPLLSGCYARHNGIPLFNGYGYKFTPQSVEVQKGDTLYSLSRQYEVSLRGIIEANNLSAPYNLNVGQKLNLPVRKTYKVVKGDTLFSISRKHNVDITSLSKLNDLKAPYELNVGQILMLPDSLSSSSDTTLASSGGSSAFSFNKVSSKSSVTSAPKQASAKVVSKKTSKTASSSRKTVSSYRASKFIWPVNGKVVSNFGVVGKGRRNDGINIKAVLGSNVKAADKGVVAYAGNELKGFGNLVLIKHPDGYITAYAHNDKLFVKKGQSVIRGEKIATVGETGSVNSPQLHFEVRAGKKAVNPRSYLP